MTVGISAGIPFEVACGGNAECCTCHVFIPESVRSQPDYINPEDNELDALDFAQGVTENSRLACQTKVCSSMEGSVIEFLGQD